LVTKGTQTVANGSEIQSDYGQGGHECAGRVRALTQYFFQLLMPFAAATTWQKNSMQNGNIAKTNDRREHFRQFFGHMVANVSD
jgi:hypothetical protein